MRGKKDFVPPNSISLAEAFATRNSGRFAVYGGEDLIGFVMIGHGTCGDESEPSVADGNYVLWRFMIDKRYQRKGYARAMLDEIAAHVKAAPCGRAEYLRLSCEPENLRAKSVYEKYGFAENGQRCGEETVAVLAL